MPNASVSAEKGPEIFNPIQFGLILKNVVYNPASCVPDYNDVSITKSTHCTAGYTSWWL
jgi:phosphoenolpyruvate carboxykinase (ATP)